MAPREATNPVDQPSFRLPVSKKAQRRELQRAVDGHSYIKDDSTYIEAYGGSKFDMQLQIDAMKEVLRKIERDEAEARAKGLLPETSDAD